MLTPYYYLALLLLSTLLMAFGGYLLGDALAMRRGFRFNVMLLVYLVRDFLFRKKS